MTTTTTTSDQLEVAELGCELARYNTLSDGERVLVGLRVDGVAIVIDAPAGSEGRVYLVERDVARDGYAALRALIAEYVASARATGRIPMAKTTSIDDGRERGS